MQAFVSTRGGALLPIAATAAPLLDAGGRVVGAVEAFQDVSRERGVDRMKSELVSVVSHELRTPLSSLVGFSELLLDEGTPLDTQRQWLGIMHQEALRLGALIDDLLDLSRIEARRLQLRREALNLEEVVRERLSVFAAQSQLHQLRIDLPPDLPPVMADRDRLRIILSNLLSNAIKYSPEGGTVTVSGYQQNGEVEVQVADQGIGIPSEQLGRVFERFHRVDSSSTREVGGTGLGLAIVKGSVEMLGGKVRVESEVGRGSTFYFTLPAASVTVDEERR